MPESDTNDRKFFDPPSSAYKPGQPNLAKYGSTKRYLSISEVAYYATMMFPTAGGTGIIFRGHVAIATAIAMAESNGDILAHNSKPPDDSYGLWQINMIGSLGPARRAQFGLKSNDELFNPANNAIAAKAIYNSGGWRPWSTYTNGAYKKYLEEAKKAAENPTKPATVQAGETNTKNFLTDIADNFTAFLSEGAIRVAGFVGGAGLVVAAVVLLGKKGIK
jgi:hypothetical protein